MALAIESVLPARFPTWTRKRPFEILFLGDGLRVPRSRLVVQGLETIFPDQVGAGWMARDSVPDTAWFDTHFRTELGPFRRGQVPGVGVYLFHLGWVAGHHPVAGGIDRAGWLKVRAYLIDRMRLKASSGGDDTEWVRTGRKGQTWSEAEAPSRVRRRPTRDSGPYDILEVDVDADDAEVKSAYRTALKLNHPDRVAHLSRQIQQFAQERTQLIVEAWSAIKQERGLR